MDGVEYKFFVKTINTVGESEAAESKVVQIHHNSLVAGCGKFGLEELQDCLEEDRSDLFF